MTIVAIIMLMLALTNATATMPIMTMTAIMLMPLLAAVLLSVDLRRAWGHFIAFCQPRAKFDAKVLPALR